MASIAIVALGSLNDESGKLSSIAIERCDQALLEYRNIPGAKILPTGGWGNHFNTTDKPHGHYVREYLLAKGVPSDDVLECAESSNTIEDAALSKTILERHAIDELIVVTSDFHISRAQFLFEKTYPKSRLSFSSAVTHLSSDELTKLWDHEKNALEKLKMNNGIASNT